MELSRQRGRGGYSRRGKQGVRGDGHSSDLYQNQKENERVGEPRKFQCYYCNKFCHIEKYCRLKEKHAKFDEQESNNESETLFMSCYTATMCSSEVWFIDSGCINHLTTNLQVFIYLDKSVQT